MSGNDGTIRHCRSFFPDRGLSLKISESNQSLGLERLRTKPQHLHLRAHPSYGYKDHF